METSTLTFSTCFRAFSDVSSEENDVYALTKNTEGQLFIQSMMEHSKGIFNPIIITEIPSTFEGGELGRFQDFLVAFISNTIMNVDTSLWDGDSSGKKLNDICKIMIDGGIKSGYPLLWIENRDGEGFVIRDLLQLPLYTLA